MDIDIVQQTNGVILIDIFIDQKLSSIGEMVLYESAKVPHGRQYPFNGTFFDNIFVHFRSEWNFLQS